MAKRTITIEVDDNDLMHWHKNYSAGGLDRLRDTHKKGMGDISFGRRVDAAVAVARIEAELERRAEARQVTVDTPPGTFVVRTDPTYSQEGALLTVGVNPQAEAFMVVVNEASAVGEVMLKDLRVAEVQGWEQ